MKISNNRLLGRGSTRWIEPARQRINPASLPGVSMSEYKSLARYMISKGAKALSDKGASKGGHARAESLTPKQRSEIASNAAQARWLKQGKI